MDHGLKCLVAHCLFSYGLQSKNGFYILNGWEKNEKNILQCENYMTLQF